ncbi:MAG TPA: TIGR02677 family protein [Polyangiaceae bacterium]|nr:TIGR02677 family protein [Polyangiaceae bacterium]
MRYAPRRTGPTGPSLESVQEALSRLAEWGNLIAQPDTSRVATLEDFYRARLLYRLSAEGEAVEEAMAAFEQALVRRAELQSVALQDIETRLEALHRLSLEAPLDATKVHQALRDLLGVFTSLSENAQAFMAGIARSLELQRAEAQALMTYKQRLIDYLERFIGDLVVRSSSIAGVLEQLQPATDALLAAAARREARDAAPDGGDGAAVFEQKRDAWRERWLGLQLRFVASPQRPSQAELLRGRARSAIPQLLAAITSLNDRRSGKSDRSADFQLLARWFAECASDFDAHRLYRAAFALSPARHLALLCPESDTPASTPWSEAAPVQIHPKLRERGSLSPRGPSPRVRDRSQERQLLAAALAAEQAQVDAARAKLARGEPVLLSELGPLDRHEHRLLLTLLGEALAAQRTTEDAVERYSGDGTLRIRLEPLAGHSTARVETELGTFSGRDHRLTVWPGGEPRA